MKDLRMYLGSILLGGAIILIASGIHESNLIAICIGGVMIAVHDIITIGGED